MKAAVYALSEMTDSCLTNYTSTKCSDNDIEHELRKMLVKGSFDGRRKISETKQGQKEKKQGPVVAA
jgi:hypothetical protein